ncbi:hypothetical protein [Tolypothrix bouteillei]|uniref:hypothetical protein n=1 Tax=Tolypothrix bouteillei TaxID=1246981 RepID=UPI0010FA6967
MNEDSPHPDPLSKANVYAQLEFTPLNHPDGLEGTRGLVGSLVALASLHLLPLIDTPHPTSCRRMGYYGVLIKK